MRNVTSVFSEAELSMLHGCGSRYADQRSQITSPVIFKREHERLMFDYIFKSAQFEGSTYDAFDTEDLLKKKKTAEGKDITEAIITWNHNDALEFIHTVPPTDLLRLDVIEETHRQLTKDLGLFNNKGVRPGVRDHPVGISGTKYQPPSNKPALLSSFKTAAALIKQQADHFSQSVLATMLLSYLQLFEDGNKRTARMIGYAFLANSNTVPITYRGINGKDLNRAVVLFYERNNIGAFKGIFCQQVQATLENYFMSNKSE